jgi:hypothetical protein
MRRVTVALGVGLIAVAAAIVFALSHAPVTVAGVSTAEQRFIGTVVRSTESCQPGEVLPRGTSAIRLRIFTEIGPRVTVRVLSHGRIVASGERASGWTGGVVTVPVRTLSRSISDAQLCFNLLLNGNETASAIGSPAKRTLTASGQVAFTPERVRAEYLRPGRSSWWSLASAVARHMGLGHFGSGVLSGVWSVPLVILLMAGAALVCSRLILRELR